MKNPLKLSALLSLATTLSCTMFGPDPIADFSFTGGATLCQVVFENKSENATSYVWEFGDGTTSRDENPSKTYDSTGKYSVTLNAEGPGGTAPVTKQVEIVSLLPIVTISPASISISLPNNCPASFKIRNSGPEGSVLEYAAADDGALQGYLDVKNAAGSLSSGDSATMEVSVKPEFLSTGFGTIAGSTLVLHVNTPRASNTTTTPVAVAITSVIGIWSGTWSGVSNSSGVPSTGPEPTAPVNGTWVLDLQAINPLDSTASGTLTWNGSDKYWVYTFDSLENLIATPYTFIPDRTIQFTGSRTFVDVAYSSCDIILLTIKGYPRFEDAPSQDAFYGPGFNVLLDTRTNTALNFGGGGFLAHPYDSSNHISTCSYGDVMGSKQK